MQKMNVHHNRLFIAGIVPQATHIFDVPHAHVVFIKNVWKITLYQIGNATNAQQAAISSKLKWIKLYYQQILRLMECKVCGIYMIFSISGRSISSSFRWYWISYPKMIGQVLRIQIGFHSFFVDNLVMVLCVCVFFFCSSNHWENFDSQTSKRSMRLACRKWSTKSMEA